MSTTRRLVWFGLLFIGLHAAAQSTKEVTGPATNPPSRGDGRARNLLTNLPLEFEANTGQSDPRVRFISRGSGLTSFLTDDENVIVLKRRAKSAQSREPLPVEEAVVRLKLDGARPPETFEGLEKSQGISNYFIGNDPSKWVTNVPHFREIRASAIYPGIDLVYYGNGRQLEYDFRVRPGTDPNQIRLLYSGAKTPAVDAQGDLILQTPLGSLTQRKPVAYQEIDGKRREVKASYFVREGKIRFNLGAWDRNRELIIDPILEYSTFLGGNGDDFGYGIAVDSAGEAFVTGSTSSSDFPTTSAFQALASGFQPAFVTKFNSTGTALIYSTYIGGGGSDQGAAIAVDNSGNAYITGSTSSNNFPTTSGAVQRNYGGGGDAFITKFSVNGNQIVYSSYLGGGNNDAGTGIALNGGQAFITGYTQSNDFPNSQNAFQRSKAGMTDAFVASFSNSGTSLVYSTFLGGDNNDQGAAIAVDSSGVAVVTGFTASSFNSSGKFPVTLGAYQTLFFDGLVDAFVTKLNSSGSALIYSTYLGGFGNDYGNAIALDASGAAYVTGYTQSSNFPVAGGGTPYTGGYDVFVTKLNPDGRGLAYSTLLPGGGNDTAYGIAVDSTGAAVVAGYTNSSNFPTTDCAYQTTPRGGQAGFITKLTPGGPGVTYSTLFGGGGNDTIRAIALDSNGAAYVTGFTSSTDFPTTPGAYQPDHPRNIAAFVSKLNLKCAGLPTSITAVSGTPQSTVVGTAFSMPLTVKVTDAAGNVVNGVTVTFTVPGSGASAHLFSNTGVTDSNGAASVLATANTIAGSFVVSASFTGLSTPATFNLTNTAGSAQSIAFVQQPGSAVAGAPITPSVSVSLKDSNNNPISGAAVTLSVPGGAATLNGTVTQMTDAAGLAIFPGINITKAGTYRLQASGAGLTFLSSSFDITPGSSHSITPHAGGGQSAPAGGVFPAQLQASVQDTYQNAIPGAPVTFTAPVGGATVTFGGPATVTTDANGLATAPQMTASAQAGAFQVTASTTGAATPAAFTLSITGATANKLAFVQGPSDASAGATIVPPVTVQLEDSFGNPVRTAGVAVALQLNPAATLYGTPSTTTDANGRATFADLSVRLTGQYALVSQSSGVTSAVSNTFRITAGAPASIQVAGGTPQSTAILTAFAQPLLATVTDFFGNLASGVTVSFAAPASGASATLSAATAVTDASGHASVRATANATAGSYLVTATTAGVTGSANFSLTNLASGASQISFSQQPSNTPAGAHITPAVVVLVLDAGGNPTAGAVVAVNLQDGTAVLGGTLTATTDAAGHATFSDLSVNTAGTYQLAAVSGSLSAVSSGFAINPSTASVLISVNGGDGASATVGLAYSSPLTALVVDAYQNPLAGLPVTFTAPVIGASVTFAGPATVISDFNGIATSPAMTANTQSGAFHVSATVPGAASPAVFNLTNLPGSSHALAFVQQPVDSAAGATITPAVTVRLQDSFGNASPTAGVPVTLVLQSPRRQKSLSGTATQLTDANGLATFADLSVPLVGQYQFLAESAGVASATSTPFNIRAGAAASIQATGGTPQSAAIATAFPAPLVATVSDASGNPISGVTVNFAAPGSGASATLSPSSAVTDANGHASITATANITAGSYAVTATTAGVSGPATFALTNTPSGASQISFTQQPTNAPAGASITPAVVVKLLDGGGNAVGGAAVTMSLAGGTAALGGTLSVNTGANGQATFSDLSITRSGTYQLVASSGSASNVSAIFTIRATTSSGLILVYSGSGQTAAAGGLYSAPLQALVEDLYQNPIGGAQVSFTPPVSGASVTFGGTATVTTDAHGIATSPAMTANSVTGDFQVSAAVAGAAPVLFNLTNLPGSSHTLALVQQPVDTAAGATIKPPVTVRLQDSFGNASPTPGIPVTLQLEAPLHQQKSLSGTATQLTDATGVATFADLSVASAGQYQLLAQSPGAGSATSAAFTIRAGAATSIRATAGTPQSTAILTAFTQPLIATVTDASGNPVSGVTVTFAAPASGASATLSAATAVTDVTGRASVTATANATAGSYLVTATTAGVTASANFALINLASAPSQISFFQQPTNALAGAHITPPVVVQVSDAGGNPTAGAVVAVSLQGPTGLLGGTLTATTDASGHATFSDLSVNTAGTYQLAAVSGSLSAVSSSFTITPSTASAFISVNGGDAASAIVGLAYSSPLTALVVDAYQNPLAGFAVTFTAPTSGASVTFAGTATVTTDANGIATAPAMTANTLSGVFQVSATVQGAASPALFNLTNLPGSSHALAFVQQPVDSAAGAILTPPVTVRLQDSFGNASPTPGVPVTLQLQAPMRQKTLSGTGTRLTDANGVATFADLSVPLVGQYQLLAESTGVASATSATFNIHAGAAASIQATGGTPQSAAIATAFPVPLVATVSDASGNPVSGVTVNFAAPGSGASATLNPSVAVTDASGHASITATANITAGSYAVTATASGVPTSASFALTNIASGASQISFVQQPTNAPAGASITPAVIVKLLDGGGNAVSGAPVTMSLAGATATLGGTLTVTTGANGQATFSDLSITKSGTYQLVATSGSASNVSTIFTIQATTSSGLILVYSGNGQTAAAGALYSAPLQALVEDLYQNPIGGAQVTFTAPASGASVTFGGTATVTTDAHGVATSPAMTANSVTGDFQVSAAVAGAAPVLFNLTNLPGSSQTLAFVQQPVNSAAGASITPPVTVRLQDSFGNAAPTPGIPVTLQLEAPQHQQKTLSGTTTRLTDATGLATFADLSVQAAGTYQLLAQSPSVASATSTAFTIRAGAATSIQATGGTPQSTAILTAFAQPLQATVTDASGNPVSGVTVNFAAPGSGASAVLSAATAVTDTNGHASVTATANATAGSYLVTAATAGVAASANFALINLASAASQISFFQQPTNALAGAHITPAVVVLVSDAGGNPTAGAVVAVSLQGPTALLGGTLTATTDASGHATFSDLSVNTAGTYQLAAVSGSLSTVSSSFTITPSTASVLISVNGGDGQSATVGLAYSSPLTALVVDDYQNPLAGLAVTFSAPASGAGVAFAGAATVTSDANGIATSPAMTANTLSGAFQVGATVQGAASPALFNLTNLPGSSHALVFVQQPVDSAAGAVITPPVTVRLQDSFGNASPTPGVAITLLLQAPMRQKSLSGTATRLTDANGVATFADLSVALVGQYQLLAESPSVASATSTAFNIRAGAAASIQATSGTPQSAAIATAFPAPLVATVSDASGNPVSGVTVTFAAPVSGASATLSPSFAVTDAGGHASVTATANITAGSYAVTATPSGVSTSASFALANAPSGASQISFVQQPTNAAAGAAITPAVVVKLLDGGGNPVSGAPVTMNLAGGTAALGGTLAVNTGSNGQATFSDLSITKSGTYQLVATSGNASNVSTPFTIQATTASGLILVYSGNGQTAAAGALYSAPLQALVEDLYQNPIGGAQVTFTAPTSSASVTFGGTATVTTDAHGIATSPTMTANSVTGAFQVTATVAGAAPVLFNLTNLPGTSHTLAFVQQPVDSAAGATITPPVTVRLQDSFGNAAPTPGVPITLQLQAPTPGQKSALSGTATQLTDATGLATFADLSVQAAGQYQLLAQSPGAGSATSVTFNIRAGAAASIQATAGTPQSTTILTAFAQPLLATVTDASGNPVGGVTVNFAAPASGVSATLSAASAITDASGHASVTATANATAGSYLVTAATSGVTASANFALINLASAASQISFFQQPTNALAGAHITPPVVVQVSDAGGNPTAGAVVAVSLQGPTALLGGTLTATTDGNGHATFSDLSVNTAGTYQLAAVSGSLSAVSSSFTITPSTASAFISVNGGDGQSETVGLAYTSPLTALLVDAYQNPLAGLAVIFTAPTSGASVTFAGAATVTSDANGIATAPAMTANTLSGAFQVSATVQGAASPALFSLTNLPGSSHALAFAQQPVDSAAGAVITPAVTVRLQDSFGNASPTPGVAVTLLLQAPMRQKSLSGTATRITDANGVATFADLSVPLVGQYQLLAESTAVASATSTTFNIRAGAGASIQATSGTPQSAAIATTFPAPLVATVSDASGNPVSGVTVSFAAPGSGASATFNPSFAVTDASGHASVTATANITAGSYAVTATAAGVSSSASFALTNIASGASQISYIQQPTNAPAGASITPAVVVKLLDGGGNPVGGASVTMSLAGGTAALGGTLTVNTGTNGQATFSDLSITKSGTYQLVATSGSASNVSAIFTISATTASGLILVYSGNGQTAAAGALYSAPLQALVEDLYQNPIGGAPVTFTAPTSGASVTFGGSATVTTDAHGVATSPAMTANSVTGDFQVSAAVAGAAPVLFNLTNLPGSSQTLAFVQQPVNTAAGATITPPITVRLQDSFGNAAPTPGIPVTLQLEAPQHQQKTLSGTTTRLTDATGLATFADLSVQAAGTYQLLAQSPSVASATSTAFTIRAGAATSIQATGGTPQSTAILTAFAQPLQATVTDASGNPVSGVTVNFAAPGSGASAVLSAATAVTDTNGHASVTATANATAGTYLVTAAGAAGVTVSANFALTNLASGASQISFFQQPTNALAGAHITPPVVVQVSDAGGNPTAGAVVAVSLQGPTALLGGTLTTTTDASGHATFSDLSVNTAGIYQLAAVSGSLSAVSSSFTITPSTASVLISVNGGDGQSATVGLAYSSPLTALLVDAYQNPLAGLAVTFTPPASGASVTFAGAATVTSDANGIATAPAMTANTLSGAFQVSATVQGAASPALFNLTNLPGSSHALAFVQQPVDSAAGATITPPVTVRLQDSFGNASPTPGVAITLQLQAPMRQKSLSGTATRLTDANGVATFADLSVPLVGQYQLLAESTAVASATSTTFTIRAGAAATIQATGGTPQSAAIATAFPVPLVTTVSDASGNPVSGVTVNFAAPGSGASATLSPSFAVTDASGHASITATANTTAGSYAVTATAAGVSTSANFALTNAASGASQISFVQQPTNAAAGASITPAVVVKLLDGGGNAVSGAAVTMSLAGGTASLGGTLTVNTGADGQATFSDLSITKSGTYQLVATSGNASNVSAPFTIRATTSSGLILVYSGNGQTAAAGALYSAPLQALVKDPYQNPIGGATVTFTAPASGASVTFSGSAAVTTDIHGIATSPAMTANSVTGDFQVSAAVAGASPALFNLTNLPGSSHTLAIVQQPLDSAAGATITPPVTVRLQDSFGNASPTPGVAITLQLQAPTPGQKSALSGTATRQTDANGVATFADLSVQAAGQYQLLAQSPGAASATSATFTIRAGAATSIQATGGTPQTTAILTAFAQPLQATVADASGNPVSGVTVNFAAPGAGASATLSATSAITDASGHASVTATANATAGNYLVTASASGVSGASFALTNLASGASQISFFQEPSNALAGAPITPPVVVLVSDAGGNPTVGAVVAVSLQGPTALLGGTLTATTDASGHATFSDLSVSTAGTYQLAAVSGSLSTVSSNFTITPSTASVLISANGGDAASAIVGLAYSSPLTALVVDAYQNPLAGLAVTFTAPTSGASVTFTGPATVTSDANGIATAPAMTANTLSGAFQVSATVQGAASPALFNLTNLPGSSHALAFVQQPVDASAGAVITPPVTVRLQDSFGNASPTPGVAITLQLQAPMRLKSVSGTATRLTDANGVATFADLSVPLMGQYQLLALSPSVASATSTTFNIRAGSATAIQATSGTPQSTAIATAFPTPLVATVTDASGNPVSGVTVSFAAPGSGAAATLSPSFATTDASGHVSVTATANITAGSYAVTATASGVPVSANFSLTNTASGASQISFIQQPTNAAAGTTITPPVVVKLLDGGGNPVSGAAVTMSLTGGTAELGGTLTVNTGANGQATFSDLSITKSGTYQLVATSGSTSNVSAAFTIRATTASGLILAYSGSGQTAATGVLYIAPLQALVEDLYHNPIGGAPVTFTAPASGASVTFAGPTAVTTDVHGIATSPAMTANSVAGDFQVSATVPGATAPAFFNLTNAAVSTIQQALLKFIQQPTDAQAGATIAPPVTVQLEDASGNPVRMAGVPVTMQADVSLQSQHLFSGNTTQSTDTNGLATFSDLGISLVGTYQLLATSSGVASATSQTFRISTGISSSIQATGGTPQSAIVQTAYGAPLQVTVSDASGNPVSGVPVVFSAPTQGPSGSFGGQTTVTMSTDSSGHALAVITANNVAGTFDVTASSSAVAGSALFALTNLPAGNGSLAFIQQPSNAVVGQPIVPAVTVQVRDGSGNPLQASGIAVILSLSSGTGALSGTAVQLTAANGIAAFSNLSFNEVGTKTLRAVSPQQAPADSQPFQIVAGGAANIAAFSGSPQAATVSQPFPLPLKARVTDTSGNAISGVSVTFAVAGASGAGGTFAGPATAATDALGIATSPLLTANGTGGSFVVTATAAGVASPAVFTLTNLPSQSGGVIANPSTLTFASEINQPAPSAQTVQISADSTVTWQVTSPASWLTALPANGAGNGQVTVSVNPAGLSAGTYSSTISITDSAGGVTPIFATYAITSKPGLVIAPSVLVFTASIESITPPAQTLTATSTSRTVVYSVSTQISAPAGGNWLQISTTQGQTTGSVNVTANPTGLSDGVYDGAVIFTPTEQGVNSVAVPVTLIVGCGQGGCQLQPEIAAVVNGASFHPGGAPRATMTILGTNLSDAIYQATTYPLPTKLGPTSVTVNGIAAPLFYASPTQINFQMPGSLTGSFTQVVVNNQATSSSRALSASQPHLSGLTVVAPGLFITEGNRAAALNADLSPHTPATPIPAGGSVILYITGEGPVTPPLADGTPAPASPLSLINAPVQVIIGGQTAQVTFQGAAPGFVGLAQINAIVPSGLAPGNQPVFVSVGGVSSNTGLITVK